MAALVLGVAAPHTSDAKPPTTSQSLVASAKIDDKSGATSNADNSAAKESKAKPQRFETFAAQMPTSTVSGFRMGGAPEVEFVFGDIDIYKRHIEKFRDLHDKMANERVLFADATHAAQQVLAAGKAQRSCPADAIAQDYARASRAGVNFRRLGTAFETSYFTIRQLDQLGESSGLTPDYRWQVKKSRSQYRQALTDLREMRAVFKNQLEAGLRARGCQARGLMALADKLDQEAQAIADAKARAEKEAKERSSSALATTSTVIRASTATFFVDNEGCTDTLNVHVDGTLLGQVAPGTKAAFQSLMGRHSLCLLGESGKLSCGETGTLRNAFVYDGWSISRHCE